MLKDVNFLFGSDEESKNCLTQFILSEYPDVMLVSLSFVSLLCGQDHSRTDYFEEIVLPLDPFGAL